MDTGRSLANHGWVGGITASNIKGSNVRNLHLASPAPDLDDQGNVVADGHVAQLEAASTQPRR
jgi:hypothetical protein